jgi:4-amino-4-deoxy-L-arabinose transferase-like glycosyltransferase
MEAAERAIDSPIRVSAVRAAWPLAYRGVLGVVCLGLVVRVLLVGASADLGTPIVDEQHYVSLATSLADGHGFAWGPGAPTSIRPPLYPFFIASVWKLTGTRSLQAVRWAQVGVALFSILALYLIGLRLFDRRVALAAAAGLALYPSLLFSGVLLLSETVFIAVFLFFVLAVVRLEERPSPAAAAVAGIALGLAALTRSVLWPFILILAPFVYVVCGPTRKARLAGMAAVVLGYVLVVGPWSIRNTTLQGTFVAVDTMGGLNLLMGNYEHTPEDRMWDAVSLTGEQAWYRNLPSTAPDGRRWTEGTKEKWAQREALAFMADHPITTLRRSLLKFADFWGLERDFVAGVQRGYYHPPLWLTAFGAIGATLGYIATAVLAMIGICLTPPTRRAHAFLILLLLFICGIHTVVFGHSRYHLPLVPVLLLYAASAVMSKAWRRLPGRQLAAVAATALIVLLGIVWSRELLVRDWDRIRQLLSS